MNSEGERVGLRLEVEERHLVGEPADGVDVSPDVLPLVGEIVAERVDKALPSLGDAVGLPVFREEEAVGAVVVDVAQPHLIEDAQVLADGPDVAARSHAAYHVHSRVEAFAPSPERLQASADGGVLLHQRHPQYLLGQQGSREESAEAGTDNQHVCLFHVGKVSAIRVKHKICLSFFSSQHCSWMLFSA